MPMGQARWDNDARGKGIADGRSFVPLLDELRGALQRQAWIAEQPADHLLPHLQRWCDAPDSPLAIDDARSTPEGTFEVDLSQREPLSAAGLRQAVLGLVGSIAEGATFIYQQAQEERTVYVVATGLLDEQTPFQSHGHTLRFSIRHSDWNRPE
jgi:hypothetical protein